MQLIRIFTAYWGDRNELYEEYAKPSLKESVERLEAEGYAVEYAAYPGAPNVTDALLEEMRICLSNNALFWLCPPDTIFGAQTMYNVVKMSEGKPHNIAFPHFRISLEKSTKTSLTQESPLAPAWPNTSLSNRELTHKIFSCAHSTFSDAFDNQDENLTHSGISIRKITNNLFTVVHNLPTVYLAKFTQWDYNTFQQYRSSWGENAAWGRWDREWLEQLTNQNRIKVVGSNAAAIAAELTSDTGHKVPLWKGLKNNDMYDQRQRKQHHLTYNKFLYVIEL